MSLVFHCPCGKRLKAAERYAGKRVKCPGCARVLTLPSLSANRLVSAAPTVATRPTPPPLPSPAEPVRSAFDALDLDDRPLQPPKPRAVSVPGLAPARLKLSRNVILGLGVSAAFLLIGGGVLAWVATGRADANALSHVPADAQGYCSVRVGELWRLPAVQKALTQLPKGSPNPQTEVEKALGVGPADIDRVTVVFQDVEKNAVWAVITTGKPYDRGRILDSLKANGKEMQHGGKTYHVGTDRMGNEQAVHFVDPRMFVVCPTSAIATCLEQTHNPKKVGRLASALASANARSHLSAGFTLPQEKMQPLKQFAPPPARAFAVLLDAIGGQVAANIGDNLDLHLGLTFADAATAKQAKASLEAGLLLARGCLADSTIERPDMKITVAGLDKDSVLKLVDALSKITLDVSENNVAFRWKTPLDAEKVAATVANSFAERQAAAARRVPQLNAPPGAATVNPPRKNATNSEPELN